MISYLLNFVLCSGILLLVYRVFLQGENLYKFNRFYLLFSLVFSLIVPLINIQLPEKLSYIQKQFISTVVTSVTPQQPVQQQTVTTEIAPVKETVLEEANSQQVVTENQQVQQQVIPVHTPNYLPEILMALYLLSAVALLLRFARNGYHIGRIVSQNPVVEHDDTKLVLLNEEVTPHSFLKYVFINKKDYSDGKIEPEIIYHEQTHVRQLHSLDIILVELIQAVCWFNPIILLYRRAIQLNHEFLADEAVIKNYQNTSAYQYLLLNKASQGSLALASPFNYLTTKKRLIMMTKTTSAKIALYKKFAVMPVLAAALILFCHKVIAKAEQPLQKNVQTGAEVKSNRLQMVERPISISIAEANIKIIPPAKNDAPQQVKDEYATILKKYNITTKGSFVYSNLTRNRIFSRTDRLRLQDLFNQMSKAQQDKQEIQFGPLLLPTPKNSPAADQLTEWRTKKRFQIYIDGKNVDKAELAKYKPTDFDCYQIGVLAYDNPDHGKYKLEVDLMTPDFYAKDYKQTLADQFQIPLAKGYPGLAHIKKDENVTKTNVDEKNTSSPDFVFITKPVPPSKTDAPQNVLDEYAAILKKHNLPPDTSKMNGHIGITFVTSKVDRLRLQDLFNQMSKAQQNKQEIQYGALELPSPKRSPSTQQLADWQNDKKFRVWIDNKNADAKEIARYKPEDLDGWEVAHLSATSNPNYKRYQHEVHLMTHAGYNSYYKQAIADRYQMPIWTVSRDKFTKHKAE